MNKSEKFLIRIVDDDASILEGLSFMLRCEGYDVRTYTDAVTFLHEDMPSLPGCLILDVRMPNMTGLELFAELRRRHYAQPVLFLSGHGDIEMAVQALHDGAADFLVKPVDGAKLVEAVAKAFEVSQCRASGLEDLSLLCRRWETLTKREKEIIRCVGRGWMNKTIACEYDISIRTVEAHRAKALHKLGLQTRTQVELFLAQLQSKENSLSS